MYLFYMQPCSLMPSHELLKTAKMGRKIYDKKKSSAYFTVTKRGCINPPPLTVFFSPSHVFEYMHF